MWSEKIQSTHHLLRKCGLRKYKVLITYYNSAQASPKPRLRKEESKRWLPKYSIELKSEMLGLTAHFQNHNITHTQPKWHTQTKLILVMVLAPWSSTRQGQCRTLNLDRVHLSYWRSLHRLVEAGDEKVRLLSKNLRMSSRLEDATPWRRLPLQKM